MIILIILGMAFVTMVPRLLPALIIDHIQFSPWINRWLQAIPYAALGALIVPGIFFVIEGAPYIGLIGGLVAVILSYIGFNVIFVVLGAIMTVYVLF